MRCLYFEKNIPRILITKALGSISSKLYYGFYSPIIYNKKFEEPKIPHDNWVKIKNELCGVCGTDLSFFKVTSSTSTAMEPMPGSDITFMGHETIGTVVEVGPKVTKFKVGDRVTRQIDNIACDKMAFEGDDKCQHCKDGNYCLCENYGETKKSPIDMTKIAGGFADYCVAGENIIKKVPDSVDDKTAIMIEPAAVGLHSVLRSPPEKDNEMVLVLGGGTIGLLVVLFLRKLYPNLNITVLEKVKSKQEFAKSLGADDFLSGDLYEAVAKKTNGKLYTGVLNNKMILGGFDRVYDCIGTSWSMNNSIRWLKAKGTYVKIGHHFAQLKIDETPIWWQELNIIGVDAHGMEDFNGQKIDTFDLIIKMLEDKSIVLDNFVTHVLPMDDYKEAFKLMMYNPANTIKIALDCSI